MSQFIKSCFKRSGITDLFYSHTPFNVPIYKEVMLGKNWLVNILEQPYFQIGDWYNASETDRDIFLGFDQSEIERLRKYPNTLYLFNYITEGGVFGNKYFFYEMLTISGIKNQIPPEKIFFVSSNILEEEKYNKWQKDNFPNYKINVISFNWFSEQQRIYLDKEFNIDETVSNIKEDTRHFLSLNRRKKIFRNYTCYKIWKSTIYKNTLVSYDKFLLEELNGNQYSNESIGLKERFINSSPSILDYNDFETNWAYYPSEAAAPVDLFKKSLISTVSESIFDNKDEVSLFYSEKTFKPMIYNQPLIIFGQQNLNTSLEKVGFKTYKNYFNFDFENIEDHYERIDAIISQLETINDQLSSYTVSQKIDWILQDRETLEYNKEAIKSQDYNKMKLRVFIDIVNSVVG